MAGDKQTLKERWAELPASRKRIFVMVGAFALIACMAILVSGDGGSGSGDLGGVQGRITNDLMPTGAARELGVSGMAKGVRDVHQLQRKQSDEMSKLRATVAQLRRQIKQGNPNRASEDRLRRDLTGLRAELSNLKAEVATRSVAQKGAAPVQAKPTVVGGKTVPVKSTPIPSSGRSRSVSMIRTVSFSSDSKMSSQGSFDETATPEHGEAKPQDGKKKSGRGSKPANHKGGVPTGQYIPSGTIIQGVMITGLDAPTGKSAIQNPIPVLVRVKHNAILPNRFAANVEECFILASGRGDLASERAYLRSTRLSCVRKDKKVIDMKVEMYAVGPDGKAGVRGRLVSKQGQVIAKASLAGLAQGISQAFSGSSFKMNLGDSDVDYGAGLRSGLGQGVGSAFDRIAKYYLDLADQMFPVVEVDAGQKVSFVLVSGTDVMTVH